MLPDAVTAARTASALRPSTPCWFVVDPPAAGAWNMAVDEALLERATHEGQAALRFYLWSEPTLSLGYSQRIADRALHVASQCVPAVRRISGGGALVHDRELTYSICLPATSPFARRPSELYSAVHEALIETLADLGVRASLFGNIFPPTPVSPSLSESFVCFARRGVHDVVLQRPSSHLPLTKIVGSAQRRPRGALLQHGAVLLERSTAAPELPGLSDLAPIHLTANDLIAPWSERLVARLDLQLIPPCGLTKSVHDRSRRLAEKYQSPAWTARR
jgi:lipoate-protein ligase A